MIGGCNSICKHRVLWTCFFHVLELFLYVYFILIFFLLILSLNVDVTYTCIRGPQIAIDGILPPLTTLHPSLHGETNNIDA
jgi:hypothetical protein